MHQQRIVPNPSRLHALRECAGDEAEHKKLKLNFLKIKMGGICAVDVDSGHSCTNCGGCELVGRCFAQCIRFSRVVK